MEGWSGAVKNSGYFPVCNAILMLKIDAEPGCTRTKGCISARETNKNKKGTSKLEKGLNFTVNVDFWFCREGKKPNFCRFSMTFCSCPNTKDDILQKEVTLTITTNC